ncbi:50S ribosomal protein L4, partial [Patescibacteria group bacterium]|nr:50S ribosomal protein L4 [Patescibacteria group bacterium]
EAVEIFKKISSIKNFEKILSKRKNLAIIVLPKKDDNLIRGFRNLAGVKVSEARNLNVLDLLKYKFLVFSNTKETINAI